ncbi:MAG: hypothetical protein J5645_06785, partial [Lachnospiraceae bacterium]|nr:hypothetical protein [Lachnospiraceae bacterium]
FRKVVFMLALICCMLFVASCGSSPSNEKTNIPTEAIISPQGSETGDGITPTSTPTPTEAEKSYRFKIAREFTDTELDDGCNQYDYQGKTEFEYDSSGNVIWRDVYTQDGDLKEWYDYEYDSEGRKIKETIHSSENEWVENEYDSAGRKIKYSEHRNGQVIELLSTYEQLDETGRTIKETNYNAKGLCMTWFIRTYDTEGRLLASEGHVGEAVRGMEGYVVDALTEIIEKEYDEFGECIKSTYQYPNQEPYGETKVYERNERGNITRIITNPFPEKPGSNLATIEEFSYDSYGNVIEDKIYGVARDDANMTLIDGPIVEYNLNGKICDTKVLDWDIYEYDEFGRRVKHEILRYDGIVKRRYDYEYVNDLMLLPNQQPTVEFEKSDDFDFPIEDQVFLEELEKTHIEPFLHDYIMTNRIVIYQGTNRRGYQTYKIRYNARYNGALPVTLVLYTYPLTRISWDVTKVADNLHYEEAIEYSDDIGSIGGSIEVVGFEENLYLK